MVNTFSILSEQTLFRPELPRVVGNVDYLLLEEQLRGIDEQLTRSGVERECIEASLERWLASAEPGTEPSANAQLKYQEQARLALRCNIARVLLGESFRDFSVHLADSALLQRFCHLGRLDVIQVPSKSSLQRFASWYPEDEIRQLNARLLLAGAAEENPMELERPLDLDALFLDTTCVKANIHFPVDWVLLRDGTRTLVKAIVLIRQHGLKHRIPEPEILMQEMNKLCLQMTHSRRRPEGKKERKRTLRRMKKLVRQMACHASRYYELLDQHWSETDWSRPQAEQVLGRIQNILDQLPQAQHQAHERIIGERKVPNHEKILSLYESDVHVIVRGKAGAEVEFGNGLLVAETPQGLLLHWEFMEGQPPADTRLLAPAIEAIESTYQIKVQAVSADRGFESRANEAHLEKADIFNGLCARDPEKLKTRLENEEEYQGALQRRAQTEGRIGTLKNQFLGRPARAKGFGNRQMAVAWGVFTHNLWKMSLLPRKQAEEEKTQSPQEARLPQAA